jgi:hypothetical protein
MTALVAEPVGLGESIGRTDEHGNEIIIDEDGRELVVMLPLSAVELAHYVVTQPEIARARDVMVEVYRRLTDAPTPPSIARQITEQIDALAAWLGREATR